MEECEHCGAEKISCAMCNRDTGEFIKTVSVEKYEGTLDKTDGYYCLQCLYKCVKIDEV